MHYKNKMLAHLLALYRLPGMGPVRFNSLLNKFNLSRDTMSSVNVNKFIESTFAKNDQCFIFPGQADWQGVEQDLIWAEARDHHIVTILEAHYPELLKTISAAPPILFVLGNVRLLSSSQIAIVGSRNPSSIGCETAAQFAEIFTHQGFCVTSGLALGIDGAAHRGALRKKGRTIAVLANGLNEIYPKKHKSLAEQIIQQQGALVSEFPIGIPPLSFHFPRRNRIISGLSWGTLVVEATSKSGSLITAQYALEQGREVFAVPGSIYSPQAQGCHDLIRQGAKLVETPKDVLEEMKPYREHGDGENKLDDELNDVSQSSRCDEDCGSNNGIKKTIEKKVFSHIGFEPSSLDTLLVRSGLTIGDLSIILLELELKGSIETCIGGFRRRVKT